MWLLGPAPTMRTPPHLSIEQQLNPAWRTTCLFFSMVGSGLGGRLFWWRSWLFTDSQIHSCFKEIVFSLFLKEGLSCKTSILLQANYMWSSKILKAGPVGWGLAQEWGTSEHQTIDYLRSTWFNMGYFYDVCAFRHRQPPNRWGHITSTCSIVCWLNCQFC